MNYKMPDTILILIIVFLFLFALLFTSCAPKRVWDCTFYCPNDNIPPNGCYCVEDGPESFTRPTP